ncbi:multiple epidermal growth factor-like domains protein 9 [Rhincodon typus]|uniref:multiple epidermal growth factor-like domains protein 9 n=1 Tax=Rhincodon typus TaxID=259920 RepID=UPI0020307256|nr:multiple epidermal growth factor-like domains protein 9 [Rhincodon typus]
MLSMVGKFALIMMCLALPGLREAAGRVGWNTTEGYNVTTRLDFLNTTSFQEISTATERSFATSTVPSTIVTTQATTITPTTDWEWEESQEHKCNCSIVGSTNDSLCNSSSGQCDCLPGYVGLQCNDCAGGFYRSTINGQCTLCGCNETGAVNSQCDSTGKCHCKGGVTGLKCNQCQTLHYKFSEAGCRPCQCSNLSKTCDDITGICLNCTGNSEGRHCEKCKDSYYRKPGTNDAVVCERCPCSVVTSSGSCHIVTGEAVCDQCKPGYFGSSCEECADGYYNSDSICVRCECNNNIEINSRQPICDSESGRCLSCTLNTTGFHCEKCAEGYTGDAVAGSCQIEITTVPTTASTPTTTISSTSTTISPSTSVTNSTFSAKTQTFLSTLLSTPQSTVSTTEPLTPEISWTQFNIVVLVVIIAVVVLLMGFVAGVYVYREYRNRKLNAPFWTIELKEDNISFSSYHDSIPNADVSGLLEDDVTEVVPNGQLSLSMPMNSYKI